MGLERTTMFASYPHVGTKDFYAAADVDALLAKLSGLTCKAEGWEADEDIIVVHGVGIVGSTLSRRNSGAVARWFNGAMAEIMERLMKGGV